jgi:biotin operon repressor
MKHTWKLRSVGDRLIKDLEETTLSFAELGKRYGVSRQAIFGFCQWRGIKRPKKPKREHTQNCSICQSLLRIAKKPHSDFISSQTIKEQLKLRKPKWLYHIHILRKKGLISQKFGRLKSRKAEKAYQIYFKKRLPVRTIGRQVGLKNFYAIIKEHRALGWDVPAPLFKYDSNDRRKIIAERNRKKRES